MGSMPVRGHATRFWLAVLILLFVPALAFSQSDKDKDKGKNKDKGGQNQAQGHASNNSKLDKTNNTNNAGHNNSANSTNTSRPGNNGSANGHSYSTGPSGHWTPPSNAKTDRHADGSATVTASGGRSWETDRTGAVNHFSKPGMDARFDHSGRVTYEHDSVRNVTITRTAHYGRTVEVVRPDGARVVRFNARAGFVERPWVRPGFVARTYVVGGVSYTRVYRSYTYMNIRFAAFVPGVYFAPGFYAWGYAPWSVGVAFQWGWFGAPWFGFYGGYFAPYPLYAGPPFWLTDYVLADDLQAAYAAQQSAAASAAAAQASADAAAASANAAAGAGAQGQAQPTELTPEIKQAIADEVQRQLQAEQAAASNPQQADANPPGIPAALDPNTRIFIVSSPLAVNLDAGTSCDLSPGDVVTRIDDTPDQAGTVRVSVVGSKGTSCRAGSQPRLKVTDLEEMHNDFQAQIEKGMSQLAQGQKGLPTPPPANPQPTGAGQASPDPSAANLIQQAQQTANQSEADAKASAQVGGTASSSGSGH
jgi:hypothetical protein